MGNKFVEFVSKVFKKREPSKKEKVYNAATYAANFRNAIIIITSVVFLIIVTGLIASIIYQNNAILITIASIVLVYFAALIILFLFFYNSIYKNFYQTLYYTTKSNIDKLKNYNGYLSKYQSTHLKEINELNDDIDQLNVILSRSILINKDFTYDKLPLDYVDKEKNNKLITFSSFLKYYREFILSNELYRNAFICFTFDTNEHDITPIQYEELLDLIMRYFPQDGVLVARRDNGAGYILYCPYIDSMNQFSKQLNSIAKEGSTLKISTNNIAPVKLKVTAVIYPYSNLEDIIGDLRYALRQTQDVNIYIPDRFNNTNRYLYHTVTNLNNIAKIYEQFASTPLKVDNIQEAIKTQRKTMLALCKFLNFDAVGIAIYNQATHHYYIDYEEGPKKETFIFKADGYIPYELVEMLVENLDHDGSLYFSDLKGLDFKIKRYFDMLGVTSGYITVTKTNSGIRSIVYFLNKGKTLQLDNYNRETLLIFTNMVSNFSRSIDEQSTMQKTIRRYKTILTLTNYNLYTVERDSFLLTEVSGDLEEQLGEIKEGETCYKKLYGLDKPCENCILRHNNKRMGTILNKKYESSLVFERVKGSEATVLLTPMENKDTALSTARYDRQLLIHSFYAFKERINSIFLAKSRFYVLILTIDNMQALLEKYGEEGYQTRLRYFFRNYNQARGNGTGEVYVYKDDTFAIVFPEEGRMDILDKSEKIYDIEQRRFSRSDLEEIPLKSTYLVFEGPLSYNSPEEFLRNVNRYLKDNPSKFNKDLFIFADGNYERDISRERFISGLLDEEITKQSISYKLLPEVKYASKKILGAEILLRLTDPYRNQPLNPYEFIQVAVKNGKIALITNYIVQQVGEIYKTHGLTAFKLAGLRNINVNAESKFFQDKNFISQISELVNEYHLPRGFLGFEFNESDLAENLHYIENDIAKLRALNITLIVDNYTGSNISLDKLKQIGFSAVKISRSIVGNISKDKSKLDEVRQLIEIIKENGFDYRLVGVEDKYSAQLINEIDPEFVAEGYYFYEPLDLEQLLDKLRLNIANK